MKAAILENWGEPILVGERADPVLGTGEVIVDVAAAGVLNYSKEVFSGERQYMLSLPAVPGPSGVGRVRALGPDATHLKIGDWVYCDCTVRSRDNPANPDITLQGWSARGEGGMRLQAYFHDGSWAEQMRLPTENAVPIGDIRAEEAVKWASLGSLLVPYGGLLAGKLQPGETLLISGATGGFGSSAVALALAMGAGSVVATGRNEAALTTLVERFGSRVRPVRMEGDEQDDRARILAAAPGPIDMVLDLLPPMASAIQARNAMMAVRPYGRVVLMGGVNMTGGVGLELPYVWIMRSCISIHGQWMYGADAVYSMVKLVQSGQIDLDMYDITAFPLEKVSEAVEHAASAAAPFNKTILTI